MQDQSISPAMQVEMVGGGVEVVVSKAHTFGTDSFLLSYFSAPKKHESACDLGSGCGIIPLLWLRTPDGPRTAYGVDVQPLAVEQMRLSRDRSGLGDRFRPILADLKDLGGAIEGASLRLVTCNPPYKALGTGLISEADSDKIARHETLCTLDDVCACAARLLQFSGRLCVSMLPERLPDVMEAMRRNRLEPKRLRFVQHRAGTAPWLVLVEGRLGCKPFLQVESPLILRNDDGSTSDEMQKIYGMYGKVEQTGKGVPAAGPGSGNRI